MTFKNERTRKVSLDELSASGLKPHKSHRGTVALNIEGRPPMAMEGTIWTEAQTEDPNFPHETIGYMSLKKVISSNKKIQLTSYVSR